jgi:hypothetical protein
MESLSEILRPNRRRKNVDIVMIPRPPTWIRRRITIWPNNEKSFPVSFTTRPVTQVAEVAVNRASVYAVLLPDDDAKGSHRTREPNRIAVKKLIATIFGGLTRLLISASGSSRFLQNSGIFEHPASAPHSGRGLSFTGGLRRTEQSVRDWTAAFTPQWPPAVEARSIL